MKKLVLFSWMLAAYTGVQNIAAQETFPLNGPKDERPEVYAFKNAVLVKDGKTIVQNAVLVIEKGKVKAAGANVEIPANAVVYDLKGKYIYPSFIEPFGDYGVPQPKPKGQANYGSDQLLSNKAGAYSWNEALKPEFKSAEVFVADTAANKGLRAWGYGASASGNMDGIARGLSVFVSLADGSEQKNILKEAVSANYSFKKGISTQAYPGSLMGAIALLKQTYLDAQWYAKGNKTDFDLSLKAWNTNQSFPQIFEVDDVLEVLRADAIGDSFGKQYIFKSGGDDYKKIAAVKKTGASFILPLNFPETQDVTDPYNAMEVSLADLKHWEMAPSNPAVLAKEGIEFAFTSRGFKNPALFMANLRKAVKFGLSKPDAIKALTETPAKLLGVSDMLGKLEDGKTANFIIVSGDIFEEESKIQENWVQGQRYMLGQQPDFSIVGAYKMTVGGASFNLEIKDVKGALTFTVLSDTVKLETKGAFENSNLSLSFKPTADPASKTGILRLSAWKSGTSLMGNGFDEKGAWVSWKAEYQGEPKPDAKKEDKKPEDPITMGDVLFPFNSFGTKEPLQQEDFLIKNATVWTNEAGGIMQNTDVLVRKGKIAEVGKNLSGAGVKTIDGTGKHLTAGIIDEHSHIAMSKGVNEWGQAISAEVHVGDIINSEDGNIYKTLAGGVTASQLLHGSANPIGGKSALVKWRWGKLPEEMKIEGADGFIKFALGENVTRSNMGNDATNRYPQSRMGVEQLFIDAFTKAREYDKLKASGKEFRRDMELETLSEILNKKRFITCHSYVQSEINMLMNVAEKFNFRINTFTHILEGYKVADKMKEHGVGASTFSDWWAYKYEVKDAIPYNAALLHKIGVVTAINSDNAEMGRRLNQEAAKIIKYGGVSEEEAWKMVTLNPAKLLHLDSRMGSIKAGKDADLVIWSEHPLSVYTKAEKTFVDGTLYFDLERDAELRKSVAEERQRIIQKMAKEAKNAPGPSAMPQGRRPRAYDCDDIECEYNK